jgi:hypothetical protein
MSHPSPRTAVPPCLPLFIKDLLKEAQGFCLLPWAFAFSFLFLLWGFFFLPWSFLVWEAFGREQIAEGKKIAKGEYG